MSAYIRWDKKRMNRWSEEWNGNKLCDDILSSTAAAAIWFLEVSASVRRTA